MIFVIYIFLEIGNYLSDNFGAIIKQFIQEYFKSKNFKIHCWINYIIPLKKTFIYLITEFSKT